MVAEDSAPAKFCISLPVVFSLPEAFNTGILPASTPAPVEVMLLITVLINREASPLWLLGTGSQVTWVGP